MIEYEHSNLNIVAYRYAPIGPSLLRISLGDASIQLQHNVIESFYKASCRCGTESIVKESPYQIGLPVNGGEVPNKGTIGLVFGYGHRWIRLHCGGCAEVQWYFREDELGG